jgi:hypothetical protein
MSLLVLADKHACVLCTLVKIINIIHGIRCTVTYVEYRLLPKYSIRSDILHLLNRTPQRCNGNQSQKYKNTDPQDNVNFFRSQPSCCITKNT